MTPAPDLWKGGWDVEPSFDKPDTVKPQRFSGANVKGDRLSVDLPSKSVVVLNLQ